MSDPHSAERKLAELDELITDFIRIKNRWFPEDELSRQQKLLLQTLSGRRATIGELANELNLSNSATTLAIQRLERDGYIRRTRDEVKDRRVVWVETTEKADERLRQWLDRRVRSLAQLIGRLDADEQTEFIRLMRKILQKE